MINRLFKKYKINAYGVTLSRYYIEDYIPEWLEYYFKKTFLRFFHILFGHKWGKWSKFSYVAPGKTGFATIEDKQRRYCGCYAVQSRAWNKKNQKLLEKMQKRWGKAIGSGYIGELYGVRFVETKSSAVFVKNI